MDDGVKFDKMKIAAVNAMPGVSFAATAVVEVDGVGPRLLLHGGQRRGLSKELWVFEAGDGWTQLFKPTETTPWPAARTQMSLNAVGAEPQTRLMLFGGYVLNRAEQNDVWECQLTTEEGEFFTNWSACDIISR